MKRNVLIVGGLAIVLMIVALFTLSSGKTETIETDSNDIKELVQQFSTGVKKAEAVSITGKELTVTEIDESKTTYTLPEDEFFVSIAPYINETHPCEIHSLTGCQGELTEEEFDVSIKDEEGNVVVDEKMQSGPNGFIDLWLPRDQDYQVTIEFEDKTTESTISTFEQDNTCIATMQLAE